MRLNDIDRREVGYPSRHRQNGESVLSTHGECGHDPGGRERRYVNPNVYTTVWFGELVLPHEAAVLVEGADVFGSPETVIVIQLDLIRLVSKAAHLVLVVVAALRLPRTDHLVVVTRQTIHTGEVTLRLVTASVDG